MIKVYGIKTCGSVKKALKNFADQGIEVEFVDIRATPPTLDQVKDWADQAGVAKLLNTKGTTYRKLNLKEMSLSDQEKLEWMSREPLLIKRPVVEKDGVITVGLLELGL